MPISNFSYKKIILALLLFVYFSSAQANNLLAENSLVTGSAVASKAQKMGRLPVIIKLKVETQPANQLSASALATQEDNINRSQNTLIEKMDKHSPSQTKCFQHLPMMSMELGAEGVEALLDDPNVESVYEDKLISPSLIDSTSLIGSTISSASGAAGENQVIAILDTGVDRNHPFLSGKVIDEACFSSTVTNSTSVCPNNSDSQIGTGAAAPCSISGCSHGTHVAGIAAGKGSSFSGVAPEANIMAVQVFSNFAPAACGGGSSCIQAFTSDIISGLEHVYSQRNNFNIASVNLSLAGGSYTQSCDNQPIKDIIDLLKTANIATVVASGNDGFTDAIGYPACVSSAIAVGATTKSDVVASYSNSSNLVDILAPGSNIQSSIPGTGYAYLSGTSMATPHIAGAFAALRSKKPSASVDRLLNVMQSTGVMISDSKNNLPKPRIQLDAAAQLLSSSSTRTRLDFDTDAKADLLWRHSTAGINWMYHMNGTELLGNSMVNQVEDPNWQVATIGDLDNDGDADIFWRHKVSGLNAIYLMDGSTIEGIKILNQVSDLNWKVVGSGDFNKDGTADILWRNQVSGVVWIYLMKDASVMNSLPVANVSNLAWQIAGIADFNNDKMMDIIWRNTSTGQNWMYLMNGSQVSLSKPINYVPDLNWRIVGLGDRNNDGNADIIWRHKSLGIVWSYLMDGHTILENNPITSVSPSWKIAQVTDFNGDGKVDIFWRNTLSGLNWTYLLDGDTIIGSKALNYVNLDWEIVSH